MAICDETIVWSDIFEMFSDIYDKSNKIQDLSVLQGIAIAREIKNDVNVFLEKLEVVSFKALICSVLNAYDFDDSIKEIETEIEELFQNYDNYNTQFEEIERGDFLSLSDLESAVEPLINALFSYKDDFEIELDESLIILFQPLIEVGATQSQIVESLDEVEYELNPFDYIKDVFLRIAEKTLEEIQD